VETSALHEAEQLLMSDSRVAVIQGNSGDGKTFMAWELLARLADNLGVKPAKITTASQWMELVNVNVPQIVCIDDMFGSSRLSRQRLEDEWIPLLPDIAICLSKGFVRLVLPMRKKILAECWDEVKDFELFQEHHIVD
jgi:hypothetical protein